MMLLWLQWIFLTDPLANPRPWFSSKLVRITLMDQFHPLRERWVNFCWNGDVKGERGRQKIWKWAPASFILEICRQFNTKKFPLCSNYGHMLCWGSWVGLVTSFLNWSNHLWSKGEYYLLYSFNVQVQYHLLIKEWRGAVSGLQGNFFPNYSET